MDLKALCLTKKQLNHPLIVKILAKFQQVISTDSSFIICKDKKYQRPEMLMPINNHEETGPQKVDICFFNSFVEHLNNSKCSMGFYIFRTLFVGWLLVSHLLNKETDDQNVYNMATALFVIMAIFNVTAFLYANWTHQKFLVNSRFLNVIAQRIQHSRLYDQNNLEEVASCHEPLSGINLKVSKNVYQFENNILTSEIDQQYRRRAERNCSSLIAQQISADRWIKFWTQFFNLTSIALFTYTIILLSQGKGLTTTEFIFVICYLFSQICSRIFIYLILFIIGISPLFCFGFCIYSCFCKKQHKIELPPTQQATLQIVNECEGNCPVCYQDVKLKEQVVVLKCSPKHVFHDLCIKGWTRLRKDTCPVCRATI